MRTKKGFTLVEMLIAIGIISVLATIIAPTCFQAVKQSKIAVIKSDFDAIKKASFVYYADNGRWPSSYDDFFNHRVNGGTTKSYLDIQKLKNTTGDGVTYFYDPSGTGDTSPKGAYLMLRNISIDDVKTLKKDLDGVDAAFDLNSSDWGTGIVRYYPVMSGDNTVPRDILLIINEEH